MNGEKVSMQLQSIDTMRGNGPGSPSARANGET